MSDDQLAHEILVKEDQLIRISTSVIYGCAVALIAAAAWLTAIQSSASQTKKELDEHLKSGAEYRALNDARWLRVNNALIRLQERAGIKVPREDRDPLTGDE